MCPGPLLLLLLAALSSESAADPENSTGLNFIVVFPENIAYYVPHDPENKVQVTALHDGTKVTLTPYMSTPEEKTLNAGESQDVLQNKIVELKKHQPSERFLSITSNKHITVQAISRKHNSMQTALVFPTEQLGTEYLIPPRPTIPGTTEQVTVDVTERSPFKLIIASTGQETMVTIEGAHPQEFQLQANEVSMVWLHEEDGLRAVKADQPVAVLFAHTCAYRNNCTCGLLYTWLQPTTGRRLRFFVPTALPGLDNDDKTFLLLSEKKPRTVPFDPDSPLVEVSGTVVLYRPGFLLPLIPETQFAPCFVVNMFPSKLPSKLRDTDSFAVIVVHKEKTDGVRIRQLPPASPDWQELKGTDYVSTSLMLTVPKNIIWHKSSNMAVYFVGKGKTETFQFGNPAAIITTNPDVRGCPVTPEVVEIGDVAMGWRESVQYCREKDLELVSLSDRDLWEQIHGKISLANTNRVRRLWIGMRRNSRTGQWYWLNNDPVTDTNWRKGEPGMVHDGQCTIMSLDKDFKWSDEDCCKEAYPLCYRNPVLLPF